MKYYYKARKILKYIGTILKNSNDFIKLYKIQIQIFVLTIFRLKIYKI